MEIKCANKKAREEIGKICNQKKRKTEYETLLCAIIPFVDDCGADDTRAEFPKIEKHIGRPRKRGIKPKAIRELVEKGEIELRKV